MGVVAISSRGPFKVPASEEDGLGGVGCLVVRAAPGSRVSGALVTLAS